MNLVKNVCGFAFVISILSLLVSGSLPGFAGIRGLLNFDQDNELSRFQVINEASQSLRVSVQLAEQHGAKKRDFSVPAKQSKAQFWHSQADWDQCEGYCDTEEVNFELTGNFFRLAIGYLSDPRDEQDGYSWKPGDVLKWKGDKSGVHEVVLDEELFKEISSGHASYMFKKKLNELNSSLRVHKNYLYVIPHAGDTSLSFGRFSRSGKWHFTRMEMVHRLSLNEDAFLLRDVRCESFACYSL